MVISSLVVETVPDAAIDAATALAALDGVEVHEIVGFKIVVTIETPTIDQSHQMAGSFITIPGVTNVNLIYFNFEDDPEFGTAAVSTP